MTIRNKNRKVFITTANGLLDADGNVAPRRSQAHQFSVADAEDMQKHLKIQSRLVPVDAAYELFSETENYISARLLREHGMECNRDFAALLDFHKAVKLKEKLDGIEAKKSFKHRWNVREVRV
jgi:hypothetical protein